MKRPIDYLSKMTLCSLALLPGACTTDTGSDMLSTGSTTFTETGSDASSSTQGEGSSSDSSSGDGDASSGDGDGDASSGDGDATSGDGDTTSGDGDGDATSGDGDGDTSSGDGDGDSTSGDGDGDATTGDGDGDTTSGDGDGDSTTSTSGDGDTCADTVTMIVRDFSDSHPDFQHPPWPEPWGPHANVVADELGPDGKPVINTPIAVTWQFSSEANFNQWYNTDTNPTNPVNYEYVVELPLTEETPGSWVYDSSYFHPIGPNDGFGSEGYVEQEGPDTGQPFNWHFTTETSFVFNYQGGEEFTFTGDDDFWGFINGKLVVDLGGVHGPASQTVYLDTDPALSDLIIGQEYEVKLFHAERRHWGSNFRMETTQFCLLPE